MRTPRSVQKSKVSIYPLENVYSFFMFVGPMEDQKKERGSSWNRALSYMLVFASIALQGIVLYCIFQKVVGGDAKWRRTILNPKGTSFMGTSWNVFAEDAQAQECNQGGSLCFLENGTYSCAPPSVQLTGRWDELDTNGDGIWTRKEVIAAREVLQCKYAVNPVEVFDVFVKFLLARDNIIWIHPDLRAGEAIHEAYFTYAKGDIIMCSFRNTDMCPNLLQRGFFDVPLKHGTAPRVGETIDSALDYCNGLLDNGGACEVSLPSTYAVWQKASDIQCRDPKYTKFTYKHPTSDRTKSMLVVNYEAVKDYDRASHSIVFTMFKSVIIAIFMIKMMGELRESFLMLQWTLHFPSVDKEARDRTSEASGSEAAGDEKDDSTTISGITTGHRIVCGVLMVLRIIMVGVLTYVGLMFLLKDTDWIDLVLNSVGLVLIVEIIEDLYIFMIDPDLRQACEEMEPMAVVPFAPVRLLGPALRDIICLVLFVCAVAAIMAANHMVVVEPLSEALECACLSQGGNCAEAHRFDYDFWAKYWRTDVPGVFRDLDALKRGVKGSAADSQASNAIDADGGSIVSFAEHHAEAYVPTQQHQRGHAQNLLSRRSRNAQAYLHPGA